MAKGDIVGKCPKCGGNLRELAANKIRVVNVKCDRDGCKFGGYWRHEPKAEAGAASGGVPVSKVSKDESESGAGGNGASGNSGGGSTGGGSRSRDIWDL